MKVRANNEEIVKFLIGSSHKTEKSNILPTATISLNSTTTHRAASQHTEEEI